MKLLTLNTHSLIEDNYKEKLSHFVSAIEKERPDIIALQEVNQTICEPAAIPCGGYTPCADGIIIRRDNHVHNAVMQLRARGINYYWSWLPIKKGYDMYDEGVAIMSLSPIAATKVIAVSNSDDYNSWKTRKLLGIRTEKSPSEWFFSAHFGWWDDTEESFKTQWQKAEEHLKKLDEIWLLGDFNSPSEVRREGYDLIIDSHWNDSYAIAENRDDGVTVKGIIDGWIKSKNKADGMRIDHVFSRHKPHIIRCGVIFNGENYPIISDHYGVLVEYERSSV